MGAGCPEPQPLLTQDLMLGQSRPLVSEMLETTFGIILKSLVWPYSDSIHSSQQHCSLGYGAVLQSKPDSRQHQQIEALLRFPLGFGSHTHL